MTDVYPMLKEERSQSPTLGSNLSHTTAHDVSGPSRTKTESLVATPLSSLTISTPTTMDIDLKSEHDIKLEDPSPSQSPTLVTDSTPQIFKSSRSPTPLPATTDGSTSKSSTPPLVASTKGGKKAAAIPVQLIADLPIAREEALKTFNEIFDNNYQYKSLGRSREALESMMCDCTYEHGTDSLDDACGAYSDCINRLTQVECLEEDCRCRSYCQNQRFQRKEYANIEIVLTEKKGYGLRAEEALPKDTFIYEYVGDVVNPVSFKKRMREYAEEGIRHFYFMMLQKDEFIDATKSGGIGRFANHSCNPNCYVAKWTVGNHVRMGIFAKRNIQAYEELTFNYNVDRYGHQAQECFCGEPMCVGYIGGKTQTDIAAMDDLYLDALGITDENDLIELKGTKKKKGKKIDDPDFMPTLKAVTLNEVPKVVQAVRQTTSRKVLAKLLMRIRMTEDQTALRQIMRLRGYSLMTNVLEDNPTDLELITLALQCMKTWPLLNRNKVQDSKVHVPVEACAALEDEAVKSLSQSLLDHWETLPVYTRIPKRKYTAPLDDQKLETPKIATPVAPVAPVVIHCDYDQREPKKTENEDTRSYKEEERRKRRMLEQDRARVRVRPPPSHPLLSPFWRTRPTPTLEQHPPIPTAEQLASRIEANRQYHIERQSKKESIQAIIDSAAKAAAEEEAAIAAAAAQEKAKAISAAEKAARRKERSQKKSTSSEDKEANKEKRLLKLVGAVVVKSMSKYSKSFDHDTFKKQAKELTQLISDKEKKSSSYRDNRLDSLSDEKVAKIKKFAKEYIAKVIRKMEKASKIPTSSATSQHTPSTSMTTPNSLDGDANTLHGSMFAGDSKGMDLDDDSGSEIGHHDGENNMSEDGDEEEDDRMSNPDDDVPDVPVVEKSSSWNSLSLADRLGPRRGWDDVSMDTDDSRYTTTLDPRRHPNAND